MARTIELGRAAVTGAAGFIGSHLTVALQRLGCQTVFLWSSAAAPGQEPPQGGLSCHDVDIMDYVALARIFGEERPRVVFHLAGVRGRGGERRRFRECVDVNVAGTVRVLEAALKAGVERIVIMGSAEEYGDQPGPQRETLPARPCTLYGVTKAAATDIARLMHAEAGCPVVVLRPYTVYGPGQPSEMFVAEAVECAVRGTPFKMSEGLQKRDFVFVEDVVDALIKAATMPGIEGEVINLGSGQATALREVAALIWEISKTKAPLEIGARAASEGELVDTWADVSKAASVLGWSARIDLRAGLERTVAEAKKR